MPASPTTQQMGELHEVYLADVNSGVKSHGSGSQWSDPADGRNSTDEPLPFAWDGKSTRSKSLTVTLDMIAKITEQALGCRPQIGLRWYGNDILDQVLADWVAVRAEDWREVLGLARRLAALEAEHGDLSALAEKMEERTRRLDVEAGKAVGLSQHLPALRQQIEDAQKRADEAEDRYRKLTTAVGEGRVIPPHVPALPWTVVFQVHLDGRSEKSGMHYEPNGRMVPFSVETIRIERTMKDLPRLIVNEALVREGDLYVDGVLRVRSSQAHPQLAVG